MQENEETTKEKEQECEQIKDDIVALQSKMSEKSEEKINSIPAEIIDFVGVNKSIRKYKKNNTTIILFKENKERSKANKMSWTI